MGGGGLWAYPKLSFPEERRQSPNTVGMGAWAVKLQGNDPGASLHQLNKHGPLTTPGGEGREVQELLQYVQFPKRNYQTCKETGTYDPYAGQARETDCESKQMVEFSEKRLPSSCYQSVQRMKGNCDSRSKERYDANVTSHRESQ